MQIRKFAYSQIRKIIGSKTELASLAQGIRKQNSEQRFGRLLKELEAGRITHERFDEEHAAIRRLTDEDFEKNVDSMRRERGKGREEEEIGGIELEEGGRGEAE